MHLLLILAFFLSNEMACNPAIRNEGKIINEMACNPAVNPLRNGLKLLSFNRSIMSASTLQELVFFLL